MALGHCRNVHVPSKMFFRKKSDRKGVHAGEFLRRVLRQQQISVKNEEMLCDGNKKQFPEENRKYEERIL